MSEDQLQAHCHTWHWNTYPTERGRLFMVHNTPRNKIDGARLKAMGMVAGVSDMIYLRYDRAPLCLEFKTEVGRQSPEQVRWQQVAESLGCEYRIIRSFDEFKEAIRNG